MFIRSGCVAPLKLLNRSNALRTFVFMGLSATILDSLYVLDDSAFWLYQPLKRGIAENKNDAVDEPRASKIIDMIVPTEKHVCSHNASCDRHLTKVKLRILNLSFAC